MKKNILIIVIALLSTAVFTADLFAAKEKPEDPSSVNITIFDAVQRVLEYNLGLKAQEYVLEKARITKNAAWFFLVPKLTLSSTYTRPNRELPTTRANPNPKIDTMFADAFISTSLGDVLVKSIINIFTTTRNYVAQKLNFEAVVLDVAAQTQKTYFDLLIARERLALFRNKRDLQVKVLSESEKAYNSGLRDELTFLKTQLAYFNAQQEYDSQQKIEADYRRGFALLMGYKISTEIILTDEIPVLSDKEVQTFLSNLSVDNNINVAAQTQFLKALQSSRTGTYFSYLPSLTATWGLRTDFKNQEFEDLCSPCSWSKDNGYLQIRLAININDYFPWSQKSVAIRHLNKDIKSKKAEIQKLLEDNNNAKESLSKQLLLAIETLKISQTGIKTAQRAYTLAQEAYNNGLMSVTDYLSSGNDLHNAQVNYVTQQAVVSKIILDIEKLVNQKQGVSTQ